MGIALLIIFGIVVGVLVWRGSGNITSAVMAGVALPLITIAAAALIFRGAVKYGLIDSMPHEAQWLIGGAVGVLVILAFMAERYRRR